MMANLLADEEDTWSDSDVVRMLRENRNNEDIRFIQIFEK